MKLPQDVNHVFRLCTLGECSELSEIDENNGNTSPVRFQQTLENMAASWRNTRGRGGTKGGV